LRLENKVAVITGGNSGIGFATAREFAANGAKLVIFGRDRRTLDQAANTLGGMKIEKLEPGKQVVWTCHGDQPEWNGTTLTWNIAREGDATVLRFTQSGWREITDFCASCNSMWGNLMFRLKTYAETGKVDPQWTE
jgi:NAD(P)-dependent dehydrogenase (short-subunit alcohol dehydrogenase family)